MAIGTFCFIVIAVIVLGGFVYDLCHKTKATSQSPRSNTGTGTPS